MRNFTVEEKIAIVKDYQDKSIKVHDIYKKYHIDSPKLMKILSEADIPLRHPNKAGSRNKSAVKKCSNCHRKIELKGARYCPYCGLDIRSEKDIALDNLNKLYVLVLSFPSTMSDEAGNLIADITNYVKGVRK